MNPAIHRISSLCWCMVACGFISGCKSLDLVDDDLVFQEVFYLSVRQDTHSTDPAHRFNGDRGPPSYGVAMLALHQEDAFTRFANPQPNRVLQQSEMLKPNKVQQVRSLDKIRFLDHLQDYSLSADPVKDVLIYIHGFKKDFARSITNAAQLRHELAFKGPVIAFSWPSNNSVTGYLSDMENVDWSHPRLRQLITTLGKALPQAKIHIVAHSIGNRAMIQSLIDLSEIPEIRDDWPLGEIVMLAPDLDKASFIEETSRQLKDLPSRITLYVSDRDLPLMTAAQVFQYPRLGDSREGPPIINGIETIDVSDAITIASGHGYYESSSIAIEDLYHLIHEDEGASERPHLKEVKSDEGIYWRLQPAEDLNE